MHWRSWFRRDQAYQKRIRYIYALLFRGGRVYVGQSVDLRQRASQHRRLWKQSFKMVRLDRIKGTRKEGEVAEQAWRCLAYQAGCRILALEGDFKVQVNPHRRRDRTVDAFMRGKRWPRRWRPRVWRIRQFLIRVLLLSLVAVALWTWLTFPDLRQGVEVLGSKMVRLIHTL